MPRRARRRVYPGGGEQLSLAAQNERDDFDDGAIPLWSLYETKVRAQDEVQFQGLLADMSGVPTFAGLFAGVITSFLVDGLKNLQPDPAQQSVYYQQQSVAMLAQISQQLASIAPQVSVPSTPPPPYPVFHPSSKDTAVNILWVAGLVFSLSAALFATYVRERVRFYLRAIQRYDHPLERARFRQFFLNLAKSVWMLASLTTGAIRNSVFLFFLGQTISLFEINTVIGAVTTGFICYPLYRSVQFISKQRNIFGLEALHTKEMVKPDKRKDAEAIRRLIDGTMIARMEPLLLAIPGYMKTEWGREVWREVFTQALAVDKISQSVTYLFDTCKHPGRFEHDDDARHARMRACVEATSSLVCLIDYRLDRFGEIGKVVSEIGQIKSVKLPRTTSDTSFVIRWTYLSLVVIQRTLGRDRLKVFAGHAVNALARFQPEDGKPDETGREGAQRIDEYLKTAWEHVEDLRRAFGPWTQERDSGEVRQILLTHGQRISDLECLKSKADGIGNVDRQISVYQDAMNDATHRLTQQLPGVSFAEPYPSQSFWINFFIGDGAPVLPQLTFPGQKLQELAKLGLKLRKVLDESPDRWYGLVRAYLESVDKIPVFLRWPDGLMKRQLWRLQDLRDGGGLGFSIELFFLSLRRLLLISSFDGSNSVFYTGTFKIITSHWEESRGSLGTHCILLNIICDLIVPGRGIVSDYSYPESITTMLLDVVGKMLQGYTGPDEHIRDAVREIESANPDEDIPHGVQEIEDDDPIRMDRRELQRRALMAFPRFRSNP